MPEEKDAAGVQTLVKTLDRGLPRPGIEIDEYVATEDRVDATEDAHAILVEEVHLSEMAKLANGLRDLPGAAATMEELGADLGRRSAKAALPVDASPGCGDATS
jgi:hypothetical protein